MPIGLVPEIRSPKRTRRRYDPRASDLAARLRYFDDEGMTYSGNKIKTRPSADLRKYRRLNTYFFLYRNKNLFSASADTIDGKFICIRRDGLSKTVPFYSRPQWLISVCINYAY